LNRGGQVSKLTGPQRPTEGAKPEGVNTPEPAPVQEKGLPRIQRLTPWSEGALRERVLDGLMDEMVSSAAAVGMMKPAE
jgi:hypothetical protein